MLIYCLVLIICSGEIKKATMYSFLGVLCSVGDVDANMNQVQIGKKTMWLLMAFIHIGSRMTF